MGIDSYLKFHDLTFNNLRMVFIQSLILFFVKLKTCNIRRFHFSLC